MGLALNYSYKNWNEDKSCFLGENLVRAVGSVQLRSDGDPLICDRGSPTRRITVDAAQYWVM